MTNDSKKESFIKSGDLTKDNIVDILSGWESIEYYYPNFAIDYDTRNKSDNDDTAEDN